MKNDTTGASPENANGLLLALRGWSRGCAALARREFARSLGRRRLSPSDLEAFARACAGARASASAVTAVAALVIACRPADAHADILRGNAYANPGAGGTQQQAAVAAAQQRRAEQVQRARDSLARTTQAIQAMRLAQDAARSAALLNAGAVFNGLGAGGLRAAAGATPGSTLWLNAGAPVESVSGGRTQVEIVQTDKKAVLTWDSFNIGANTDLYFNQKAGGADAPQWIALNRVTDATVNPSQILGTIKAEGQVYIVNPNGIVFEGSSQVNAHTLVATGLDFKGDTVAARDASFQQGLAFDDNRANYTLGVDAGSGLKVGDVTVRSGARLVSDGSGAIFLFGKNVSNAGTIIAPDGQALLAAGDRVWVTKNLLGSTHELADNDLRGVRATVQNDTVESTATNSGVIVAERGNITISAKNIGNSGALVATTTIKANGSVTLLAGDKTEDDGYYWKWPTEFGAVSLKPGSVIAVTPDDSAGTGLPSQYRSSKIDIYGRTIVMDSGASIYAPAARATLVAKTHTTDATAANDPSRIYLDAGASIDIAGLPEVEVAMERNTITGHLRLDELKDSPLLRDGPLRGAEISVDLRRGVTLADMSGYYGLIEYGVAELMTAGGALKLDSGSVITREGSNIDISGGSVKYLDGYVQSTRLLGADGRIHDISTARNDIAYTGIYDTYRKFESGYVEGKDAGSLVIGPGFSGESPEIVNLTGEGVRPYFVALEGALHASAAVGEYQSEASASAPAWRRLAANASLTIGYTDNLGNAYGPDIRIGRATPLPAGFAPDTALPASESHRITLPAELFDGNTFGTVNITSGIGGGDFIVDAGVTMNLGLHGSLSVRSARAEVNGSIVSPGGSVSIKTDLAKGWNLTPTTGAVDWASLDAAGRPSLKLGAGALIDVSGQWVNELRAGTSYGALAIDGGSVSLVSAHDLVLAAGSAIDVGGGGRLTGANRLVAGNAGSITLANDLVPLSGFSGASLPVSPSGDFDFSGARLSGYALGKGGSLEIGASRDILITATPGLPTGIGYTDTLALSPEFFRTGGFLSYAIAGAREVRVAAGTEVNPVATSLLATAGLWAAPTGGEISAFTTAGVRPLELRDAASLSLSNILRTADGKLRTNATPANLRGAVVVESGATLRLDPGSTLALHSAGLLYFDGNISVPGGDITLGVTDAQYATLALGSDARIAAGGYVKTSVVDGIRVSTVKNAGAVSLAVADAQSVGAAVKIAPGAVIDVSGITGETDFANTKTTLSAGPSSYTRRTAYGDAGAVSVEGFTGGFVAGSILAGASGTASAGDITVSAGEAVTAGRTGIMLTGRTATRTGGFALFPEFNETTAPAVSGGTLVVSTATLNGSGADSVSLLTAKSLSFDGAVSLGFRRTLSIAAPLLGIAADSPDDSTVTLAAGQVRFGGFPGLGQDPQSDIPAQATSPATVKGVLRIDAGLIDIAQTLDLGGNDLKGFASASFVSAGDIRLTVGDTPRARVGRIRSDGTLRFESAQTYVTSASAYRGDTHPGFEIISSASVEFAGNGGVASVPYSYGETLTVKAPAIVQGGVLRAPLGRINLVANDSLTLAPGSLTSVSAEGRIMPSGAMEGGFFDLFAGSKTTADLLASVPEKSILLTGPKVDVRAGATVDVSGGGDIRGYEFIAGNGGSRDILNDAGMFAVLPGYVSAAPVYGKAGLNAGALKAGDSVFLSGVDGLADGVYTLLPAHYALLQGGFAIRAIDSGFDSVGTTVKLPDGTRIVGGHRTVAGTAVRDNGVTRFAVMSGDVFKKYSSYNEYGYNDFIDTAATKAGITTPRLVRDAGSLVVRAADSLALDGRGRFDAGENGLLGNLDIDALRIALVGGTNNAPDGYLKLDTATLNGFGVGSLLLGGTRATTAAGTAVTVNATDILVANDAASALVVREIILAAKNGVTVADGSVIRAEGPAAKAAPDLLLSGNGALLRASSGDRVGVTRTDATTASGDLTLGDRVTLAASGSLTLDGTRSLTNRPGTRIGAPQLSLSSARVSIGEVPAGVAGLVLTGSALDAIGTANDLLIRSYGSIDLLGTANLGALDAAGRPVLAKLTLDSSGLNGFGLSGDTATLAARSLILTNSAGVAASGATTGAGKLALVADTLVIGAGTTTTQGFTSAHVATGKVSGKGAGAWNHSGDLAVATDLLTSGVGATTAISATGSVSITQGRGIAPSAPEAGGGLAVTGAHVGIDTAVVMPSGIFEAVATSGDLTLGEHALLSVAGHATAFFDTTKVTPAGTVRLTSAAGDVTAARGSRIDLSGDPLAGDAGTLEIGATQGALDFAGTLAGAPGAGGRGGSFSSDTASVSDFQGLNRALNAGGFSSLRSIRVRTGDIALAAGETVVAHDVALRADTGAILVNGAILAAGVEADRDGGSISLRAGNGLTLGATAVADVSTGYALSAKGFDTRSGKVELLAEGGDLSLASGATIRAAGGVRGGGSVVATAMRDGADIRVTELAATVTGAREFTLRGRRDYALTNVTTANYTTVFNDAASWMNGAGAIAARLGSAAEIQPDIRVVSSGNLTLANDVSLNTRRYAGVPGALNFEAAGNIAINGSVSDGFSTAATTGTLLAGRSWSLGFSAGGDITLAANKLVRTGTGDITLAAGRDITLTNLKSVIYTAGSKTADIAGFVRGSRAGEYPVEGGDLSIRAGRDIVAPVTTDFVTYWQYRYGLANTTAGVTRDAMRIASPTSWSIVFANFEQGVGALGGGDVSIVSGRDISNLAVMLPTTGQQSGKAGDAVTSSPVTVRGGGNLTMLAGRDILGGVTLIGRGEASLVAGGALASNKQTLQRIEPTVTSNSADNYELRDLHAIFALGDAALSVRARGDLVVEAMLDPMLVPSTSTNISGNSARNTFFSSYTDRTRADLVSEAADLVYENNPWAAADLSRANTGARAINQLMSVPANANFGTASVSRDLLYVPGTVTMTASAGSVTLAGRFDPSLADLAFKLAPSAAGNLEILASGSVSAEIPVIMMDVAQEYLRDAANPFRNAANANLNMTPGDLLGASTNYGRGTTPLHEGDSTPVRIYSVNGDVSGRGELTLDRLDIHLPKPAVVRAGQNIADITLAVQHNSASDLSLVQAGRDIIRPELRVTGEGSLVVEAGRDIDLTSVTPTGIVSTGKFGDLLTTNALLSNSREATFANLALTHRGADITLSSGASGADYAGFAERYLNPANAATVVRNYLPELRAFMASRGASGDDATLLGEFRELPAEVRQSFLLGVYFTELKETGIDVTNPDSPRHGSYARGFDAVKSLFGATGSGDINLFGKSLSTQQGGDITIVSPHGRVLVDVITNPAASSQGIVTQKGGAIRIMTDGDIALANSRVFTLQGGDVLMWTSKGDITAGAGSSTRAVPPALVYTVDSDANVLLNAGSLRTGAGIGVLDANRTGRVNSRLDLIAPAGTVDAGDAGIRSVGAINIAAQTIIGAANINAGGGITGIAAAPAVNVAAVASANGAAASSSGGAPDAAEQQRRQTMSAQERTPSLFSVEVLGYGGESDDDKKGDTTTANDTRHDTPERSEINS